MITSRCLLLVFYPRDYFVSLIFIIALFSVYELRDTFFFNVRERFDFLEGKIDFYTHGVSNVGSKK